MPIKRAMTVGAVVLLMLVMFAVGWVVASSGVGARIDPEKLPELERQFVERMRGVSMVGRFTVAGREDREANTDRYDISSVEKVGDDRWRFNARIGTRDITLPVVVTMRWVDDTPIIMLTDITIPSLGTFTVRVFFYGDRYAGTWQRGSVGGHMYGRLEKQQGEAR